MPLQSVNDWLLAVYDVAVEQGWQVSRPLLELLNGLCRAVAYGPFEPLAILPCPDLIWRRDIGELLQDRRCALECDRGVPGLVTYTAKAQSQRHGDYATFRSQLKEVARWLPLTDKPQVMAASSVVQALLASEVPALLRQIGNQRQFDKHFQWVQIAAAELEPMLQRLGSFLCANALDRGSDYLLGVALQMEQLAPRPAMPVLEPVSFGLS